jgi:hypothetical protein
MEVVSSIIGKDLFSSISNSYNILINLSLRDLILFFLLCLKHFFLSLWIGVPLPNLLLYIILDLLDRIKIW